MNFDKKLNVFRFWEAATISTFRPKQKGSFPLRSLSALLTKIVGIHTGPKFVQKVKLPMGSASQGGPQPGALITIQTPGLGPNLVNQPPGMEPRYLHLK